MPILDDLGLQDASARQAIALATPKTVFAPLTSGEAATPAVRQVVELAPGATVPEQEPPPKSPGVKRYTTGAYGRTIPISLGQRRLEGTIIQASNIVPRLVGNKEYEITYEIPAAEDPEPEEEYNDGDQVPRTLTIWCSDCNCYYCYVGPLDVNVPFDNMDKGTWPYMAMMGKWRSGLCIFWQYERFVTIDEDYHYGALTDKRFGDSQTWTYQPPPGTGLPNDPIVKLTCGPCAQEAPFPDQIEQDIERQSGAIAPYPHSYFQYGGWFSNLSEMETPNNLNNIGFYYAVVQEISQIAHSEGSQFGQSHIYRLYQDQQRFEAEGPQEWPDTAALTGGPIYVPDGWYILGDELDFTYWDEATALSGMGDATLGWAPSGQHWRDWVKEHGGWAPEDEPSSPPDYRMLQRRRVDPDDPFSEHKLFPRWADGMATDGDGNPLHNVASVQCDIITDRSDADDFLNGG